MMPEPKAEPDSKKHRSHFWIPTLIAIIGLVVAIGSAFFAYLQWREANQIKILTFRASLSFYLENDKNSPVIGWRISNGGPGPARIQSLDYFVDKVRVKDFYDAVNKSGINSDLIDGTLFQQNEYFAVGRSEWVFSLEPKKLKSEVVDRFNDFADAHLGIAVRYCSIANECQTTCSWPETCSIDRSIK
jgi:hypothetical protein